MIKLRIVFPTIQNKLTYSQIVCYSIQGRDDGESQPFSLLRFRHADFFNVGDHCQTMYTGSVSGFGKFNYVVKLSVGVGDFLQFPLRDHSSRSNDAVPLVNHDAIIPILPFRCQPVISFVKGRLVDIADPC